MELRKMDFRLEQDKQDLQKWVSGFCTEHCPPSVATALEQSGEFPADLYAAMAEAGLLKMCLPRQLGGAGGGVLDAVLITETLARPAPKPAPDKAWPDDPAYGGIVPAQRPSVPRVVFP